MLKHAVRRLLHQRGFSAVAVLTIALGIGANSAMFTVIRTVILHPLPYSHPDRLVVIWDATEPGETTWLSLQEVVNYAASQSLSHVAGYRETNANLTEGEPERVRAAVATANLFETLGTPAALGRTFVPEDGRAGGGQVIILSHALWQRRFGARHDVVGQTIRVNGRPLTIVGVMPPAFRLPTDYRQERPTEAWTALVVDPGNLGAWGDRSYKGVGRLKAGATAGNATSEFAVAWERWIAAGHIARPAKRAVVRTAVPISQFVTGEVRRPLWILLGAVAFVLLIACANVANLFLAKADVRRREIAVRLAIGASRGHLLRQLLTEALLLSAAGGLLGLVLARVGLAVLVALRPPTVPRVEDVGIDGGILAFTAILSIVTGVLFGLVPGLQFSRPDVAYALKDAGPTGTTGRSRQRLRRTLVIGQLAFSVVLVVGAGLLIRTLLALQRVDLGIDPRNVLTAQVQLPQSDYPEPSDVVGLYRRLISRLEQTPGVTAAGAVRILPLTETIGDWSITLEDRPHSREENPNGDYQAVTPGYFRAMGLTLARGRFLSSEDHENAPMTVVINVTMAQRYWPGQDAIGKRFYMGTANRPWMTIVGIVKTVRHNAVVEAPRAEMYLPYEQLPREIGGAPRAMTIVLKTTADPSALVTPLRDTIRALDARLPISNIRTMEQVTATALSGPRFVAALLGGFAALALCLAAIGIYGTISLLVTERSHEIGIRVALGAERGSILRLVLSQGLRLAAAGIALGVAGALLLTRLLETLVYGVDTLDPVTFAAVPALLAAVTLVTCLNPAWRAAAVDPVAVLRKN